MGGKRTYWRREKGHRGGSASRGGISEEALKAKSISPVESLRGGSEERADISD